ncbi:MAG: hypothetical protein H7311_10455 [Ramlibacter sp.]|nr:hypothetical protein [Cryobacterium sp.]
MLQDSGMTSRKRARQVNPLIAVADPDRSAGLTLIGGYRVLRRLASTDRADIYVGRAPSCPARGDEPGIEGLRPAGSVALKVFRAETDDASIEREVRALTETSPGRLAGLLDVATLPDGRMCLVLEQLTGGTLGRYLAERPWVEREEAVTILAPVVAAVAELQAIGLAHLGVTPAVILFDSLGRPVLTGLGRLRSLPEPGPACAALAEDAVGSLRQLVRSVLDQVGPEREHADSARDLADWFSTAAPRQPVATSLVDLEHRLFEWSAAGPVHLGSESSSDLEPDPARPDSARRVTGPRLRRAVTVTPPAAPAGVRVAGGSPSFGTTESRLAWLASRARTAAGVVLEKTGWNARDGARKEPGGSDRQWTQLQARERSWRGPGVLGVVIAALVAGVAIPGLGADAGAGPAESTSGPTAAPTSASGSATGPATGLTDSERGTVNADDPVPAVSALLRLRQQCLLAASVVCLDGADQAQSSAMAADSYTIRLTQQGGASAAPDDFSTWSPVLTDRTGDVALASLTPPDAQRKPASVLVVKGEAGWRIREIFDD